MIDGLHIEHGFFPRDAQEWLVQWIDRRPWSSALRRRTQHYGYRYSYDRRALRRDDYLGQLPAALQRLAALVAARVSDFTPDQAIVNEYLPGQGISAHIDHPGNFGPVVASVSLLSPAIMEFARAGERRDFVLSPGDLLVMREDARFRWTHAIPHHSQRRISVTFRSAIIR